MFLPAENGIGIDTGPSNQQGHLAHGYSQTEIAARVGLHYCAMNRIIQREWEKARSMTPKLVTRDSYKVSI
jgi:hypothetical protein